MCSSRKYPYPHHGGNWKFQRGGGSKSQEIPEGMGGKRRNFRPEGRKSIDFLRICQLAPLTYFTAVSFFERFKRLKTSHSLELFAKPFWGLNIGLAIKTLKKFRSRKKKKKTLVSPSRKVSHKFTIRYPLLTPAIS